MVLDGYRTFGATFIAQLTASIALFTGHLDGTQWVTVIPLILAVYGTKSVGETWVKNR